MRCLSCSSDNPSENKFCGGCGAPLEVPRTSVPGIESPDNIPRQSPGRPARFYVGGIGIPLLIVLPILAVCGVCVMCSAVLFAVAASSPASSSVVMPRAAGARGASSQANATLTAAESLPLDPITYRQIEDRYYTLTGMQRKDYLPTLIGKRVRWRADVSDVRENGDVALDLNQRALNTVRLQQVPKATALSFVRNQVIEFEAVITTAEDFLGLQIQLQLLTLLK